MKKIYLILTYTGTILSKVIKYYTKNEFSHISISLDKQLSQMYSFGRLNPYNAFIGGFVHEGINRGTFDRFKNTIAGIYSLEITNTQYEEITKTLNKFNKYKEIYKFNIIGLFAVSIHKKIHKKNSFYCAEFVKYILDKAKIENELPEIIKPEDFKKIQNLQLEYKGLLREYKIESKKGECII